MNDYVKPLAQWCLAVAIVGCLLAVFAILVVLDAISRLASATRLRLSRPLFRSRVRPRPSNAALHDLPVPVSGLDVECEDRAEADLAAFAEYGGVPFSERVRR